MASPRKSFKTANGLELPLMSLKNKEYLQVMHRIQWFKNEHKFGIIKTQMIEKNGEGKDAFAVFRAEVYIENDKGQMLSVATGHKMETAGGFADYIEKAETGAVGRALALCGYGTQFASDDLDEGNRLADSPAPVLQKSTESLTDTADGVSLQVTTAGSQTATGVVTPRTAGGRSSFRKNTGAEAAAAGDDI